MIQISNNRLLRLLQTFLTLQPTKELPRQGFIYFGFKRGEADSIAAHSFNVAVIAYLLARELKNSNPALKLNLERIMALALLHDMGEAIMGDIGYAVKLIAKQHFQDIEEAAFAKLTEDLSDQEELLALLQEYNAHQSSEAKIVLFADGLDALMQVLSVPFTWMPAHEEYNRRTYNKLKGDAQLGNDLAELFRRASTTLKQRKLGPKWPQGHLADDSS